MNDVMLVTTTRQRLRELIAAEVVLLIQRMAQERGNSPLPSIEGPDAASALRAVAETLAVGAREMEALAALALPGWEVAVTADELNQAMGLRAAGFDPERGFVAADPSGAVREILRSLDPDTH